MSEIRELREDKDFRKYVEIVSFAYPYMNINTEEDIKREIDWMKKGTEKERIKIFGYFKGEELITASVYHDFIMNYSGIKIKAGGLGLVATNFFHKKEGGARELIQHHIRFNRERGNKILMLYPFRSDFYKKMGWGFGPKNNVYKIKTQNIPKGDTKEHIIYLTKDDIDELYDFYLRIFERIHGVLYKEKEDMERYFSNPSQRIVGYKEDGKIYGYLTFSFVPSKSSMQSDMEVKEILYENPEVLWEFLTFFNSQGDQINSIIIHTQDENFHFIFDNPGSISDCPLPTIYNQINISGVGVMYRVSDIKGLFEDLKECNFNGKSIKLKITVEDGFCEENKSIVIHFDEGYPKLMNDKEYETEVFIKMPEFSSLIMGSVDFITLYKYGLCEIYPEKYVNLVDDLFRKREKPRIYSYF